MLPLSWTVHECQPLAVGGVVHGILLWPLVGGCNLELQVVQPL